MTHLTPGKNYFCRTVTDYWLGELVSVDGPYTVTMKNVSWVSHTGRLAEFLAKGEAEQMEIEPAPDGQLWSFQWVAIGEWPHPLLRKVV